MKITVQFNNKTLDVRLNKSTIIDELYTMCTEETTPLTKESYGQYKILKLDIHPKQDVVLQSIEIEIPFIFNKNQDRVFCNGYQSCSESRSLGFDEIPDSLRGFAKLFMGHCGDDYINYIPRKKGVLHSWSYGYITNFKGNNIDFIGSLNENTGFTCIIYDADNQVIRIKKDIENLQLSHSFPALELLMMKGDTPSVHDTYFELQGIRKFMQPASIGWTSWYNYSNYISEEMILKNLNQFKERNAPIDIFQIDDGWQTRVGDWLSIKNTFPRGMDYVAQQIHNQGFKAGIWLAPFIVEPQSELFKNKPNWLLKDKNGKPVKAGFAPQWSGWSQPWFYALDFYNAEVQEYLTGVFHTILDKWGYDLVKLDFLYAACIIPRNNKTRGQVMHDVMDFLRRLVGKKQIFACGVPLASAFGKVDYCSIGADIHRSWEHPLFKFLRNRERVSTISSLRTILSRWELNGRAFQSNSNVFIVRKNNQQLTDSQQDTISKINMLLGNWLFCGDEIGEYDEATWAKYQTIFEYKNRVVQAVRNHGDNFYTIHFELNNQSHMAYCNLSNHQIIKNGQEIKPFQTLIV
jgi:alpha-galactosidase